MATLENIILHGNHIALPRSLHTRDFDLAHEGKLGIAAMRSGLYARVCFRGIAADVKNFLEIAMLVNWKLQSLKNHGKTSMPA
jgi:hypothetical protein